MIKVANRYGVVSIPGTYTPTEALTALEAGADLIKVFPATKLGPDYVKELLGPMPQLKLLPTGGVNLENMKIFLEKGAVAVGIGSSLVSKTDQVTDEFLQSIKEKAVTFVQIAQEFSQEEAENDEDY